MEIILLKLLQHLTGVNEFFRNTIQYAKGQTGPFPNHLYNTNDARLTCDGSDA